MDLSNKTHIKHLYASRPTKKHGTVDIAILTDDNQYIEYVLDFHLMYISKYVGKRIRSLFEPYLIDKNTDVMVNELLDEDHPLYQYFMLLKQHIGFRLSATTLDRVVGRINYYYTRKSNSKHLFNKMWKLVIEKKQCPWITQDVEYAIQNKGPSIAKRIRTVRLAMFYIVVKNYLYRIFKKSKNNTMNVEFQSKEKEEETET